MRPWNRLAIGDNGRQSMYLWM